MAKRAWLLTVLLFSLMIGSHADVQTPDAKWPRRILITNDNGINDVKIVELARAFSRVAETYVVAPLENRSGSAHYLSLSPGKPNLQIERRSLGDKIIAYGVDGFPADCVVFGVMGLLRDNPPDLVVSGINGGPNLSADWLGSGTIGAARVAAFLGIPAIAVSGLEDDYPESVAAATQWVVEVAHSKIVRDLKKGQYLTISMPRKLPSEIKGIKIARRSALIPRVEFKRSSGDSTSAGREVWQMQQPKLEGKIAEDTDVAYYQSNYIVIVPMKADEHDDRMLLELKKRLAELPEWKPPAKK